MLNVNVGATASHNAILHVSMAAAMMAAVVMVAFQKTYEIRWRDSVLFLQKSSKKTAQVSAKKFQDKIHSKNSNVRSTCLSKREASSIRTVITENRLNIKNKNSKKRSASIVLCEHIYFSVERVCIADQRIEIPSTGCPWRNMPTFWHIW